VTDETIAKLKHSYNSKDWRNTHASFADYSARVHGISRAWAYRLLQDGWKNNKKQISARLRWWIFERDDFRCFYCGIRRFLTIDHVVPESSGGTTDKTNLITACEKCNRSKWKKQPENCEEILQIITTRNEEMEHE
jgi:hypothetical protein